MGGAIRAVSRERIDGEAILRERTRVREHVLLLVETHGETFDPVSYTHLQAHPPTEPNSREISPLAEVRQNRDTDHFNEHP